MLLKMLIPCDIFHLLCILLCCWCMVTALANFCVIHARQEVQTRTDYKRRRACLCEGREKSTYFKFRCNVTYFYHWYTLESRHENGMRIKSRKKNYKACVRLKWILQKHYYLSSGTHKFRLCLCVFSRQKCKFRTFWGNFIAQTSS